MVSRWEVKRNYVEEAFYLRYPKVMDIKNKYFRYQKKHLFRMTILIDHSSHAVLLKIVSTARMAHEGRRSWGGVVLTPENM